jgi:hypothetical protein
MEASTELKQLHHLEQVGALHRSETLCTQCSRRYRECRRREKDRAADGQGCAWVKPRVVAEVESGVDRCRSSAAHEVLGSPG